MKLSNESKRPFYELRPTYCATSMTDAAHKPDPKSFRAGDRVKYIHNPTAILVVDAIVQDRGIAIVHAILGTGARFDLRLSDLERLDE